MERCWKSYVHRHFGGVIIVRKTMSKGDVGLKVWMLVCSCGDGAGRSLGLRVAVLAAV